MIIHITAQEQKELHNCVRNFEQYFLGEGFTRDKKLCRYNDLVGACISYSLCSGGYKHEIAMSSAFEIVSSVFKETDMYVAGSPPEDIVYEWMILRG